MESKSNKNFPNASSICFKFSFYSFFLLRFLFPAVFVFPLDSSGKLTLPRPSLALTHQQRPFLLLLLHLSLLVTIWFPQTTIQDFHLGQRRRRDVNEVFSWFFSLVRPFQSLFLHVYFNHDSVPTRCKRENHELKMFGLQTFIVYLRF